METQKEGHGMGDIDTGAVLAAWNVEDGEGRKEPPGQCPQLEATSLWQLDSSRILTWSYHVHLGFALGGGAQGAPRGAL